MKTPQYHLLVVDDDPLVLDSMRMLVPASDWRMTSVQNYLEINYNLSYAAAFVDQHLTGDLDKPIGLEVIEKLRQANPNIEIYAMSGDLSLELMEAGLKRGANRFIAKPLEHLEVVNLLSKAASIVQMRQLALGSRSVQFIGTSEKAEEIRKLIATYSTEPGPILIEGESGSGKEVTAKLLNAMSSTPFIAVNMATIPESLFESELFGHVKGAFTGADRNKIGLIEAAAGGDIFFDEIEAMPLSQQAKLLRFLESGEIKKVGAQAPHIVSARVICASNRNLLKMCEAGEFREDLYWRISGKKISLPSLRERADDISVLAEFFLSEQRPRLNKKLTPEALKLMRSYSWPGNIRELKRVCEQVSLICPLPFIRRDDLEALLAGGTKPPAGITPSNSAVDLTKGFDVLVEDFEKHILREAIRQSKNKDAACELLKMSRSNFYRKLKNYNLETLGD